MSAARPRSVRAPWPIVVAAEADHLLVDRDWERVESAFARLVLPPPSDGADVSVVELVPCGGHHASTEPRQFPDPRRAPTLFSWAEFLADQPDEPQPRGRNQRPSRPSLFDWALEREQETGLAAAGG